MQNNLSNHKKRRGISLLEISCSVVVIALVASFTFASFRVVTRMTADSVGYTKLKIYVVDMLDRMEQDLHAYESGTSVTPIDSIDYSDDGYSDNLGRGYGSDVSADVTVFDLGNFCGDDVYFVSYELMDLKTGVKVNNSAVLRGGFYVGLT